MRRRTVFAALAGVAAVAGGASAAVPDSNGGPNSDAHAAVVIGAPTALRVISKTGHPTHPSWYHDSQIAQVADRVTVAYNGPGSVHAVQLRAGDLGILAKAKLNTTSLGGATDSTGTDTDRHDVPAVVADARGRLTFVYGGGTLAARGGPGQNGPLTRAGSTLSSLSAERTLDIGGGAAFDFEAATSGSVIHLLGQHGQGSTGSLFDLRLAADGSWLAPRELIHGGFQPAGCVLNGRATGCNRFAIARITADQTSGRLHMVWGWSEGSLSGKCLTDAGYCDHDLDYAWSDDQGATWNNADGSASVRIADGPLPADAPAFRVMQGHIGLFKALAIGPGGLPIVVYSSFQAGGATLQAARLAGGNWTTATIAHGDTIGSLVLRGGSRVTLWTPTGSAIDRYTSPDGTHWTRSVVYRGAAWSLTGTPAAAQGHELMVWRGNVVGTHSWVIAGDFPAG